MLNLGKSWICFFTTVTNIQIQTYSLNTRDRRELLAQNLRFSQLFKNSACINCKFSFKNYASLHCYHKWVKYEGPIEWYCRNIAKYNKYFEKPLKYCGFSFFTHWCSLTCNIKDIFCLSYKWQIVTVPIKNCPQGMTSAWLLVYFFKKSVS